VVGISISVVVVIIICVCIWLVVSWYINSKKATAVKIYGGGQSLHFQQIAFKTDANTLTTDDIKTITMSSFGNSTLYRDPWVTLDTVGDKFFHTAAGTNEWILYEFKEPQRIVGIDIKNRTSCCQDRLAKFSIQLLKGDASAYVPLGDAQQLTAAAVNSLTFT
jgi:hypothetical protein